MDSMEVHTPEYKGPNRRGSPDVSEAHIEYIADLAAKKALAQLNIDTKEIAKEAATQAVQMVIDQGFREVGKWTFQNFLKLVGMLVLGLYFLGVAKGWWTLPGVGGH